MGNKYQIFPNFLRSNLFPMDLLTILVGLLFSVIVILAFQTLLPSGKNLPPGPTPLPLIGNLHLLGSHPHKSFAHLAKIHGPLMRLRLGSMNTVVISSVAMAKQVLQKHDREFSTRSIPDAMHAQQHFKYSVVWLPVSSRWRRLRKAMNSNIFSVNRLDANQHLRNKKVEELIAYCRKSSRTGGAVDVGRAAFRTSLNLLSNTIFSVDLTDPFSDSGKQFRELVSNIMVEVGRPNLADFFPLLERIDPLGIRRRMSLYFEKVIEIFSRLIDERLEKRKSEHHDANDVLDVLLTSHEEIDRTHIERMCLDLFVAGTDTTSITVEWAMAELLRNPEIMKKAKEELAEVIGKGKTIQENDVSRLPFLRCIMKETMRIHPPAPLLVPRRVEEDVAVSGFVVAKNSKVFVNVWAIGRDPDVWKDPLEFKPQRFLESEVDVRGTDFELLPFGAGRRICPGLPLAVRMVPVMVGSLINSFDWKVEGGKEMDMDMEEKFGITLQKSQPLLAVPTPIDYGHVTPIN